MKRPIYKNPGWITFLFIAMAFSAAQVSADFGSNTNTTIEASGSIRTHTLIIGVNMWSGTPSDQFYARDAPLLTQIGIKHIRIGTGVTDTNVNRAIELGLDIIGTFGTTGLPDLNAFGDYVYDRVSHFKGRVNAWVVFNEPNWSGFKDDPAGYTTALKVAYTRAKEADPNVIICTGNLLSTEGALTFLQEMYAAGAKGYFDVLGIDPYCYPASPLEPNTGLHGHTFWKIPMLHDLMAQNEDAEKGIWIVEFGYRTPGSGFYVDDGKTVSEEDQATYLTQALELASTWPWLERFYIYEWMDSGDPLLGWWGLIRERYNPPYDIKPAFDAVEEFIAYQLNRFYIDDDKTTSEEDQATYLTQALELPSTWPWLARARSYFQKRFSEALR